MAGAEIVDETGKCCHRLTNCWNALLSLPQKWLQLAGAEIVNEVDKVYHRLINCRNALLSLHQKWLRMVGAEIVNEAGKVLPLINKLLECPAVPAPEVAPDGRRGDTGRGW